MRIIYVAYQGAAGNLIWFALEFHGAGTFTEFYQVASGLQNSAKVAAPRKIRVNYTIDYADSNDAVGECWVLRETQANEFIWVSQIWSLQNVHVRLCRHWETRNFSTLLTSLSLYVVFLFNEGRSFDTCDRIILQTWTKKRLTTRKLRCWGSLRVHGHGIHKNTRIFIEHTFCRSCRFYSHNLLTRSGKYVRIEWASQPIRAQGGEAQRLTEQQPSSF